MAFDYKKTVKVTDAILAQAQRLAGAAFSAEDIVVFEAVAASTRPITKRGSMYDGGKITRATLDEMAFSLNSGEQSVPLHSMHQVYDSLPIGRVFQGQVQANPDGEAELKVMFYLPKSEVALIESINLGITDEVSVGLMNKSLMCSKCGFDYLAADSGEALWDRTCDQGHVLGQDGTHLVLSGVDYWSELSLVSRGASKRAKILGQAPKGELQDRLAASGFAPTALFLCASATEPTKEATVPVEPADLAAALAPLTAALAEIQSKMVTPAEPPVIVIDPALAAAQAQILELQAAAAAATAAALEKLKIDLPVDGLTASAVTDAKPLAPAKTGAFKAPQR